MRGEAEAAPFDGAQGDALGPGRPFGAAWIAAYFGWELTRKRERFILWFSKRVCYCKLRDHADRRHRLRACLGSWRDEVKSKRSASQDSTA